MMTTELMTYDELAALPARSIIAVEDDVLERVAMQKTRCGNWVGVGGSNAVDLSTMPEEMYPVLLLWTPEKPDVEWFPMRRLRLVPDADHD